MTTNSKQAHTPGPWHVNREGGGVTYICDKRGRYLATVHTLADGIDNATLAAQLAPTAALIAAAPELVAALETLFNCLDCQRDEMCEANIAHVPEMEQARAALAKAGVS